MAGLPDSAIVRGRRGARVREEVLGKTYTQATRKAAQADPFMQHFIDFTQQQCWGYTWLRPGLSRRQRSMLNLAMLTALARWAELGVHVRGALNNGVTEDEIAEVILQAAVYAGIPVAAEGFRTANAVIKKVREERATRPRKKAAKRRR